jgi:hypothetical protein
MTVAQLEREVDTVIRTAREAKPQTAAVGPGAGCDAAEVVRERMAFWSALAEGEGREVRMAGVDRPVRVAPDRRRARAGAGPQRAPWGDAAASGWPKDHGLQSVQISVVSVGSSGGRRPSPASRRS